MGNHLITGIRLRRFCLLIAFPLLVQASIEHDTAKQTWDLVTASNEYRLILRPTGVFVDYFGPLASKAQSKSASDLSPAAQESARQKYDISGQAEGEDIIPSALSLVSQEHSLHLPGVDQLVLIFEHKRIRLRVRMKYTTWRDTGVFTRELAVENVGKTALHVQHLPSLTWSLPAGKYEVTHLWGGWSQERQVETDNLGPGVRSFVSPVGRSTNGYSPWFCLKNQTSNVFYLAELAYSGNWEMDFSQSPLTAQHPYWQNELQVRLGMRFDFGGDLLLEPGEEFKLPEVAFTTSAVGLDEAANQLHRFQREYVVPRTQTNDPLLVQFNSWYPFPGRMNVSDMKRCAEVAAKLGAEVFVLDAGWYSSENWSSELGDYEPDQHEFPNGIEELASYVRKLGMKFGMWIEIENVGVKSKIFAQHPDWCLHYNGLPIARGERRQLDFAKPEVRKWARSAVDRLVRRYGLEWLKIDYNIDIGEQFDPAETEQRPGDVLYTHLTSYYSWLDEVRAAFPRLVIENCSSGGLRFDLGIMAHAHTTWLSDEVRPKPSVQLAYGCTLEFTPGICNHWMVGDTDQGEVLKSDSASWWDFMFRVPMNGQFGISSRVFNWAPELIQHAQQSVSLYKALRTTIEHADVFHLTPPPAHDDPTGWMAIQYVAPNAARSVVMAYRLGQSAGDQTFKLHELNPDATYRINSEGTVLGTWTGKDLMGAGLKLELNEPWRAVAVQIDAIK